MKTKITKLLVVLVALLCITSLFACEEKITVTFSANGGAFEGGENEIKVEINRDSLITEYKEPKMEGYTFAGFSKNENGDAFWNFDSDKFTQSITLYAVWNKKSENSDNIGAETPESGKEETPHQHSFTNYISNNDATCTADGTKTAKCDICDKTDTIYIEDSKLGHSFTDYKSNNDAKVGVDGTKTAKCDRCDVTDTVTDEGSAKTYSKGLAFTLNEDGQSYSVTGIGTCTDTELIIPPIYEDLPVTAIARASFRHCTELTIVIIPDSVTDIGIFAFDACTELTSITIGNSVASIGYNAFYGCYKLVEVYNKSSLNITKGSGKNGDVAYYALNVYTPTSGESKLHTVDDYIFYVDGETIYLLGYTGDETELTLPESYNGKNYALYEYTFYKDKDITSITIPAGVTSIGCDSFYDCTNLTSIIFEENSQLTTIESSAFFGCTGLESITIPNSVTIIESPAFSGCTGLKSLGIPASVTSIGDGAFHGCTELTSITVDNANSVYESRGNCLIDKTNKTLILGTSNSTIPNDGSVTSIGEDAFYGCTGLTSITIPDSVLSLGSNAFYGCTGLTSVTIGNSVTSIGEWAFSGCTNLQYNEYDNAYYLGNENNPYLVLIKAKDESITSCEINSNTKVIADRAFYYTGLTSITIPDSVTSIGEIAFCACSGLTSITIPDSVTSIGFSAFAGCTGITSVTFGENSKLESIGELAFCDCTGLTNITIPNSITNIGSFAFSGCTGLTSVTIGNSVTSIGSYAFEDCTGLESITVASGNTVYHSSGNCLIETESKTLILGCKNSIIPTDGSVTSIGEDAFYNCTGLTSITIPDSVTSIGSTAFYNCTGLTSITIPDSVTSIGSTAFGSCTGLTSITIPNSVTNIGDWVLHSCSGLASINFSGTKSDWLAIEKGNGWVAYTGSYIVHCTDGDLTKAESEENS